MLKILNLYKAYGDKTILDIPELVIPKGIHFLKGANGSGKTTFSKIIAGLIRSKGDITLNDSWSPLKDPVKYRLRVNYSESEPKYPGFLTAKDLIDFVAQSKRATTHEKKKIVEVFGINHYFTEPCETYSSGMLKKVSLALAFLGDPALILLDEPFNTLDTEAIEILTDIIRHYHQSKEVNFILSTHQKLDEKLSATSIMTVKDKTIKLVS